MSLSDWLNGAGRCSLSWDSEADHSAWRYSDGDEAAACAEAVELLDGWSDGLPSSPWEGEQLADVLRGEAADALAVARVSDDDSEVARLFRLSERLSELASAVSVSDWIVGEDASWAFHCFCEEASSLVAAWDERFSLSVSDDEGRVVEARDAWADEVRKCERRDFYGDISVDVVVGEIVARLDFDGVLVSAFVSDEHAAVFGDLLYLVADNDAHELFEALSEVSAGDLRAVAEVFHALADEWDGTVSDLVAAGLAV